MNSQFDSSSDRARSKWGRAARAWPLSSQSSRAANSDDGGVVVVAAFCFCFRFLFIFLRPRPLSTSYSGSSPRSFGRVRIHANPCVRSSDCVSGSGSSPPSSLCGLDSSGSVFALRHDFLRPTSPHNQHLTTHIFTPPFPFCLFLSPGSSLVPGKYFALISTAPCIVQALRTRDSGCTRRARSRRLPNIVCVSHPLWLWADDSRTES